MYTHNESHPRGRPRTITRERLADAAIAIGLPKVSVVGIAAELGVSAKGLYKHFSGLDELKQLVAEEIFLRWPLPALAGFGPADLERYMLGFSVSMWELVEQHTGIAPYMLRKDMITPAMMEKMQHHQMEMARVFELSLEQASWLLMTVAYYSVAVTDTALPFVQSEHAPPAAAAAYHQETDVQYEQRVRQLYALGSRSLVAGAMLTLKEIQANEPPSSPYKT